MATAIKFDTHDFVFNEDKDLFEVDQFGVIDLRSAYVNSSVPDNVEISAEDYNGVEEPESLLGRSVDVFDSIRKASYVQSAATADKAPEGAASTPSGTE